MTVWIAGSNTPGCLPDEAPYATLVREDAMGYLLQEASRFAEEEEEKAEELNEDYTCLDKVNSIFLRNAFDDGPMTFMLKDVSGWGRVFFMAETQEPHYKFPEHEAIHTLADALSIWSLNCTEELVQKYESASRTILTETEGVTDEEVLRIIGDTLAEHDIHPLHDLGLGLPVRVN